MLSALLVTLLNAAPIQYAYEFSLNGHRVGVVVLELSGTTYRYGSVQVVNRAGQISRRRRADMLELSEESHSWRGRVPATLALVTMSGERGCRDVIDEVTRKDGDYCVASREGQTVSAMLFGKPVRVLLDDGGIAAKISFPDDGSSFERISSPREPNAPPDFSGVGYPVSGTGRLAVTPPVSLKLPNLAVVKTSQARAWFEAARSEDHILCAEFARSFVKRAPKGAAAIVHGLRVEDGRAFPHAWVRVMTADGPLEFDPTFDSPVNAEQYLPLAYVVERKDELAAGAVWLTFLNGERAVIRVP